MAKLLTIVIVTMNGLDNLKILIPSLKKQTFKDFDILVSDNGSTDGTIEWLRKNKIKFIANGRNLGFSGGANVGMKRVRTKYVAVLNDDMKVDRNCFKILIDFMEKRSMVAAAQPILNSWDGKMIESTGLVITYGSFIATKDKYKSLKEIPNSPKEIIATGGGCSVYRTEVVRHLGFFDEKFNPIYNEDADLGMRIVKLGFKNYVVPKAVIYHKGAFAAKKLGYVARLSFHRNRYRMMKKHWTTFMWIKALFYFPLVAGFYILRKPDSAFFRATYEFLFNKLKVWRANSPNRG